MAPRVGVCCPVRVCKPGWGTGFNHTLFLKYCESFFISFVSLLLIKNLAAMLCKGKAYRHLIWETLLKTEARREAGGSWGGKGARMRTGTLAALWNTQGRDKNHLSRGRRAQNVAGFGGGIKKLRNEDCETTRPWGWGLGRTCAGPAAHGKASLGQPSTSIGHLRLNQGGLVCSGRGRACPHRRCVWGELMLFSLNPRAILISYNSWRSFSLQLFNAVAATQFTLAKN